jgi:uncharacterized protein (DUF2384 family)
MAAIFQQALNEKITVRENGQTYRIAAWEGIVWRLALDALNGDIKAIEFLFAMEPEIERKTRPLEQITPEMSVAEALRVYQRIIRGDDLDP